MLRFAPFVGLLCVAAEAPAPPLPWYAVDVRTSRSLASPTVLQEKDGNLTLLMRDVAGNPVGSPWSVPPQ